MANKRAVYPHPSLSTFPGTEDGPVKLGDYLDEVEAPPAPRAAPQKKAEESKVIEMPRRQPPLLKHGTRRAEPPPQRSRLRRNAGGNERAPHGSKSTLHPRR